VLEYFASLLLLHHGFDLVDLVYKLGIIYLESGFILLTLIFDLLTLSPLCFK
jgi:hypothetical protein